MPCPHQLSTSSSSSYCHSGFFETRLSIRLSLETQEVLMRVTIFVLLVFSFVFTSVAQEKVVVRENTPRPSRPVHTFSIVARDPNTGELGVAVQSHWFSVG